MLAIFREKVIILTNIIVTIPENPYNTLKSAKHIDNNNFYVSVESENILLGSPGALIISSNGKLGLLN